MSGTNGPEIAAQLVITDRLINGAIAEKYTDRFGEMLATSFAHKLLVDGAERVKDTDNEWERQPDLRAWTLSVIAQEDFSDPSLRFLLARSADQQRSLLMQLMNMNYLPLWKIIWLRLRGKPLVRYE